MWNHARERAMLRGLPFNITIADVRAIPIPEFCPYLGIPLKHGKLKPIPNSPSLDKIEPQKGYVKGNIWIISHKANTMKSDASLTELEMLIKAIKIKLGRI